MSHCLDLLIAWLCEYVRNIEILHLFKYILLLFLQLFMGFINEWALSKEFLNIHPNWSHRQSLFNFLCWENKKLYFKFINIVSPDLNIFCGCTCHASQRTARDLVDGWFKGLTWWLLVACASPQIKVSSFRYILGIVTMTPGVSLSR